MHGRRYAHARHCECLVLPQIRWRIADHRTTYTAIRPLHGRSRRPRDLRQPQPGLDYEAQLRPRADEGSALGNSEDQALIPQRLNRSPGRVTAALAKKPARGVLAEGNLEIKTWYSPGR